MKPNRLVPLLLASLAFAACGADENEEYAEEVDAILTPLSAELESLQSSFSPTPDIKQLSVAIAEMQRSVDAAVTELEAVEAPADAEAVHSDLIAAFEEFGAEFTPAREAAGEGDLKALDEAVLALPEAGEELDERLNEIEVAASEAGISIQAADEDRPAE